VRIVGSDKILLSEKQMELIAKALAEPRRVRILQDISEFGEPMPCGALCGKHDISQATMSHHFKELENAGLIRGTRRGKFMNYTLEREILRAYSKRIAEISRGKRNNS
jgi:ArsR family transcriptional regulator, arsenate/arsenite/antimonite-responsive transcriptional repressor